MAFTISQKIKGGHEIFASSTQNISYKFFQKFASYLLSKFFVDAINFIFTGLTTDDLSS